MHWTEITASKCIEVRTERAVGGSARCSEFAWDTIQKGPSRQISPKFPPPVFPQIPGFIKFRRLTRQAVNGKHAAKTWIQMTEVAVVVFVADRFL